MPLNVLVVDDTVTYRKILSDILKDIPEINAINTAPSGAIAMKKIPHDNVQLVFLDVNMPEMDGVETLRRIKKNFPETMVVMISGVTTRNADTTIEALQSGAIDFIRKPEGPDIEENRTQLKGDILAVLKLVKIRRLIGSPKVAEQPTVQGKLRPFFSEKEIGMRPAIMSARIPKTFGVCVIGVSTGGPEALSRLVPALKGPFAAPFLCVQHMPALFTKSLAESLAKKSRISVTEANDNDEVRPGVLYIAPGGRHMVLRREEKGVVIGLNDGPAENSCRPSVDVLFRSVADVYGEQGVLSIVLTGMGSDGANGVRALKRRLCYCITQNEQSCVVYGMPRAVDEAGLSDLSLSLDMIPDQIERLLKSG